MIETVSKPDKERHKPGGYFVSKKHFFVILYFLCSDLKYKYDARFMMGCGGVYRAVQIVLDSTQWKKIKFSRCAEDKVDNKLTDKLPEFIVI